MDKLRARIKPYPTIPELQCGMPNLTKLDTGHVEINRLPLNMQTVLRDSAAPLEKQRIILRRPIAGNDVNLSCAGERLMHEIDVLQ